MTRPDSGTEELYQLFGKLSGQEFEATLVARDDTLYVQFVLSDTPHIKTEIWASEIQYKSHTFCHEVEELEGVEIAEGDDVYLGTVTLGRVEISHGSPGPAGVAAITLLD